MVGIFTTYFTAAVKFVSPDSDLQRLSACPMAPEPDLPASSCLADFSSVSENNLASDATTAPDLVVSCANTIPRPAMSAGAVMPPT